MAGAESGLMVSATARTPAGCRSTAARMGVLPSAAYRAGGGLFGGSGVQARRRRAAAVPTRTSRPSTVARNPLPVIVEKSGYRRQAEAALLGGVDDCGPKGCSLSCSAAPPARAGWSRRTR